MGAADPSLWGAALQLGLGGLAIAGLVYVSVKTSETQKKSQDAFLKALDDRADKHEKAMAERESALRSVEHDVRKNLTDQLTQNTVTLQDVAKVLGRVARHLDGEK